MTSHFDMIALTVLFLIIVIFFITIIIIIGNIKRENKIMNDRVSDEIDKLKGILLGEYKNIVEVLKDLKL